MDVDEAHSRRAVSKADKWTETGGFPLPLIKDATLPHALPPPTFIRKQVRALQQISLALLSALHPHVSPIGHHVRQHRAQGHTPDTVSELQVCALAEPWGAAPPCSPRAGTGHCPGGWRGGEAASNFSSVCSQHTWLKLAHWAAILCFPLCFHSQLLAFASQGSL